jgi:hypothetical protein
MPTTSTTGKMRPMMRTAQPFGGGGAPHRLTPVVPPLTSQNRPTSGMKAARLHQPERFMSCERWMMRTSPPMK